MSKRIKAFNDAVKHMAQREDKIEDAFILAQMKSLGITHKDLKNYTLVRQTDDGMISRRYFLKHKNDNWANSEATWSEDHARAIRMDDALRRAGEFLVKNMHNRQEAHTVDGWRSYFLNEARFEEVKNSSMSFWFNATPNWYDRGTIKITDPKKISLWSSIKMKLFINPRYIFDKDITVTYKIIGNKIYVLEIDNESKTT